jgi:deazaflavin-dependent oxidoreductase (nitroreductase family)
MRRIYRAPLLAYRAGLAGREHWLGMRWILIETIGRSSGRPHTVLVDLLGEARGEGRYFLQSAYGPASDWVRNAEASQKFWAEVGGERFEARLESVDDETARRILLAYVDAHPLYSPGIAWMLGYRGPLGEHRRIATWLADRFGMLAVVRL